MRLFVGLPVPAELAKNLARLARAIAIPKARWTAPENLHLTLVFLGEVAEDRLASIERELAGLEFTPFQIKLTSLGNFPRVGVLFAEVEPAPRLLHLQAQVVERMARCGFAPEERPYHPHITLARFRSPLRFNRGQSALPSQMRRTFSVETVNLYRSDLGPGGSRYTVLSQKMADSGSARSDIR
ncbi:RNA 2',3'-cyclic phosphodiesterase [Edaphobacter bradus]|uniref:RNA 2',3'-cyclic phosphodiesterase n=1 Tax=Edaphobacter bradus TaxID=2259016 RepID=UPI0021E073ED|nr:RNA 2',3'-cyclic phosphodiesterase [Edaphobacter bradus]